MSDSEKVKEIIEIIANMEGFKPKTAPEGYLLMIIQKINDVVCEKDQEKECEKHERI